jgi:hypothetical protein
LDDILHITEAKMLVLTCKTGLDPSGNAFEQGEEVLIPWPVDSRRPKDEGWKFMSMGENRFLPNALAPAIRRNRFTGV